MAWNKDLLSKSTHHYHGEKKASRCCFPALWNEIDGDESESVEGCVKYSFYREDKEILITHVLAPHTHDSV